MLVWNKELWLIDHGASLYFHHSWHNWEAQASRPFALIKNHVLLPFASELEAVDAQLRTRIGRAELEAIVAQIPDDWLMYEPAFETAEAHRQAYVQFLETRIAHSSIFVKEAQDARAALI